MEGEITIIAKFTRKDQQPNGPVLPVCHVTQVEDLDAAATAFMWMVGVPPPAEHYHLARMTVKDVRFLLANPLERIQIESDVAAGHKHTLTIAFDEYTGRFIVINITSAGDTVHAATLLGVGSFDNIPEPITNLVRQNVIAGPYVFGELANLFVDGRPGMEFTDDFYSYRCQMGNVWGSYVWCRYLKAVNDVGVPA